MVTTILIIDNDYLMRSVLTTTLHNAGWNVLTDVPEDINLALLKQIQP